jgi:DNA-binding transcriptional regulator WhiA
MSFTKEIKRETGSISYGRKCCDLASLAVFYSCLAEEKSGSGKNGDLTVRTENLSVGRKILILTKKYAHIEPKVEIISVSSKKHIIITVFANDVPTLKNVLRIKNDTVFSLKISPGLVLNECCKKAALAAAFLVNGFI